MVWNTSGASALLPKGVAVELALQSPSGAVRPVPAGLARDALPAEGGGPGQRAGRGPEAAVLL